MYNAPQVEYLAMPMDLEASVSHLKTAKYVRKKNITVCTKWQRKVYEKINCQHKFAAKVNNYRYFSIVRFFTKPRVARWPLKQAKVSKRHSYPRIKH